MNYYVFQVSDQSKYGKQKTAIEVFNDLVKEKSVWGFGFHTPNRKAIQSGDRVLFYLTGAENQMFVGSATLASGAYPDNTGDSKNWYLDPETLRIDLVDVVIFSEVRPRKLYPNLEWRPAQGGSSKISEKDYNIIVGNIIENKSLNIVNDEEEMEFALEKYLEDFIVQNWEKIDFGEKISLFTDENGNSGKQYYTEDVGYIDLLAQDQDGNFVVIELKKGRKNDEVIGQVLRYMGWVRKNLATKGEQVRGMIIVGDRDTKLEYALQEIGNKVVSKVYKVSFRLENY